MKSPTLVSSIMPMLNPALITSLILTIIPPMILIIIHTLIRVTSRIATTLQIGLKVGLKTLLPRKLKNNSAIIPTEVKWKLKRYVLRLYIGFICVKYWYAESAFCTVNSILSISFEIFHEMLCNSKLIITKLTPTMANQYNAIWKLQFKKATSSDILNCLFY